MRCNWEPKPPQLNKRCAARRSPRVSIASHQRTRCRFRLVTKVCRMADKQPLVSVVLPVHDGESSIAATLESAVGQTYRNTEIVVVDDGSRDGTRAIVESWVARDPRARLLAQANRGVAAARKRAVEAARGELIAPLDADDLWDPTKIERQVRRLFEAGDGTGLVYCWWVTIDDAGVLLDSSPAWRIEGHGADTLVQVNYTGNASVPLYRRQIL